MASRILTSRYEALCVLQCVAVCCGVLQCVAMCCNVSRYVQCISHIEILAL